jgi:hypothetical protein
VLHHIAVGPLAEQPAGKGAPPFAVRAAPHVELNEGPGFLHILPRRGRLARLEAHDGVAHAQGFARFHLKVARQAVALVEQAHHRDPFRHRRTGQGGRTAVADRAVLDLDGAGLVGRGHVIAAASGQHENAGQNRRGGQDRQDAPRRARGHDASGLHAS